MLPIVVAYGVALLVMALLDALWFSFALKRVYRPGIGHLMAEKPRLPAAILFYLIYAAGVTYLATLPALRAGGLDLAIVRGAVLGFIAYATYDFTSLAVLRGWPVRVTVIDLVWGTILTAVAAGAAFLITAAIG